MGQIKNCCFYHILYNASCQSVRLWAFFPLLFNLWLLGKCYFEHGEASRIITQRLQLPTYLSWCLVFSGFFYRYLCSIFDAWISSLYNTAIFAFGWCTCWNPSCLENGIVRGLFLNMTYLGCIGGGACGRCWVIILVQHSSFITVPPELCSQNKLCKP